MWYKLFQARRQLRRAERLLKLNELAAREELRAVTERYDEALAVERARCQKILEEGANRLYEFVKVSPIVPGSVADLKTEVSDPVIREEGDAVLAKLEQVMGPKAAELFQDKKDQFWEEGREMGHDELMIRERWLAVKDNVVDDVVAETSGGPN